jgi:hypothetical protein
VKNEGLLKAIGKAVIVLIYELINGRLFASGYSKREEGFVRNAGPGRRLRFII